MDFSKKNLRPRNKGKPLAFGLGLFALNSRMYFSNLGPQ
jgi:hypothetical protein